MAKSKSAKRRNAQNRSSQKHAQKRAHRSQQQSHQHLPKVGTPKDNTYIDKRRRADLVDFGLGGRHRLLPYVFVGLALLAIVALIVLLVFL